MRVCVDVAAPQDDVLGVEPVGALARLGLHAPGERLARRQVAVPVVEGAEDAADDSARAASRAEKETGHMAGMTEKKVLVSGPCW